VGFWREHREDVARRTYRRLLSDIESRGGGELWRALPRDVQARWVRFVAAGIGPASRRTRRVDVVDALFEGTLTRSNPYAGGPPVGWLSDSVWNLLDGL
jgi:hypothetical protein